jgi:hypothetical protein
MTRNSPSGATDMCLRTLQILRNLSLLDNSLIIYMRPVHLTASNEHYYSDMPTSAVA